MHFGPATSAAPHSVRTQSWSAAAATRQQVPPGHNPAHGLQQPSSLPVVPLHDWRSTPLPGAADSLGAGVHVHMLKSCGAAVPEWPPKACAPPHAPRLLFRVAEVISTRPAWGASPACAPAAGLAPAFRTESAGAPGCAGSRVQGAARVIAPPPVPEPRPGLLLARELCGRLGRLGPGQIPTAPRRLASPLLLTQSLPDTSGSRGSERSSAGVSKARAESRP